MSLYKLYQSGLGTSGAASLLWTTSILEVYLQETYLMLKRPLGTCFWCVVQKPHLLISPWLGGDKHGFLMMFPLAHSTPTFRAANFETQSPGDAPAV